MATDRLQVVRDCYRAYETDDRELLDRHLAPGLVFSAPPDVGIDRDTYWERCWANRGSITAFTFVRLLELPGDEVLITYESTKADGKRGRNTELMHFDGEQIDRIEVYWGWDVE